MFRQDVLDRVEAECRKAEDKHPSWPADRLRQAAIVVEEAGELLRAVLCLTEHRDGVSHPSGVHGYQEHIKIGADLDGAILHEAAQTAAMAMRFIENYRCAYPGQIVSPLADARTLPELPLEPQD